MKGMAETQITTSAPAVPAGKWLPAVALGWLVPGAGHFLLRRTGRGAIIFASVALMFLLGLLMRGAMFQPQTGDLLTTIIYVGGFVVYPPPEKQDSNLLMRVLWPVVACVQLVERGFVKEQPR